MTFARMLCSLQPEKNTKYVQLYSLSVEVEENMHRQQAARKIEKKHGKILI